MSHYAKIVDGVVEQVIVAELDFINTQPGTWIQTSYNTKAGIHYGLDGQPDGGIALRKNYAGVGYSYDADRDAFIPAKPYNSWTLNEETCLWECPVAYPNDGKRHDWNESALRWEEHVPNT